MIKHALRWQWVLLAVGISACAATPLSGTGEPGSEESAEAAPFEELCEEASSLVALCAEEGCGLYRCREVKEHLSLGRVVPARFPVGGLHNPQTGAQRNWGSAQKLPEDARPVFIIPWGHKTYPDIAPKEDIYRYAGQLIYEFELFGPVVPLWKQPPPLPLGY